MSSTERQQAIGRLYQEAGPLVLRRCVQMLRDPHEAMDVTQYVFVRALETGFEVRSRAESLAWLYRTATQRCLWILRNRRNRARIRDKHHAELAGSPFPPVEDAVADRQVLEQVLEQLDERTGEIVLMTYVQGLGNDRAAELLGVSVRTVGRARKTFEDTLRQVASQEAS